MPVPLWRYRGGLLTARLETQTDLLVVARAAYRRGDWESSYAAFSRAGAVGPLSVDDLDTMATAAWRLGHGREAMRVGELVYVRLTRTDPGAAATKAVELGSAWLARGELAVGRAWIHRARGLLSGAPESPTLVRLAYLETMVAVLSDDADLLSDRSAVLRELSARVPAPAPDLGDLVAAGEGDPLLEQRLVAAARALQEVYPAVAGEALYQLGDVRRRRGDVDGALAAYAGAHTFGVAPQPGAALLRCALGDVDTARAEVAVAIATADARSRPRLLRAAVEIALAGGDLDEAQRYLRELEAVDAADLPLRGAILVRRGRHHEALTVLRSALREHRIRRSPYETAQVHRWMAEAHRGLEAGASQ